MKAPIKIRYVLLMLVAVLFLMYGAFQRGMNDKVADMLQQVVPQNDFANSFTGNYLAGYFASKQGDWEKAADLFEESRKLAPDNTALLENTYTYKLLFGKVKEAIVLARQQADDDTGSSVAVILRAIDALQGKEYSRVEALLTRIMPDKVEEVSVGTVIAPFLLAWTEFAEGKGDEAIALMKDLQEKNVAREMVSYHLALLYEASGKDEDAAEAYDIALSGAIKPYHFVKSAGDFYLRQGKFEQAKKIFETYMDANPYSELLSQERELADANKVGLQNTRPDVIRGWVETLMEGVRIAYQSNLTDEGTAYLQLVNYLDPTFSQSLMLLAAHYEEMEDYARANEYYKRIPLDSSFYWESRIDTARNDYKLGNKKTAEAALRALADERPKSYVAPLELAELLREDERFGPAADAYAQTAKRIPHLTLQHWYIFYAQGVSYEQSDRWDLAEKAFLKALELNPDQADVLNYLGYSWLVKGKYLDKAQKMIKNAVDQRPDDGHILDSMGWVLFKTGKYAKAVNYLEQAIEVMPYDPTVNDHLGDTYWRLGRLKEARYQWQRVLDAAPAPEANQVKEVNEKLRVGLLSDTDSQTVKQVTTNDHTE